MDDFRKIFLFLKYHYFMWNMYVWNIMVKYCEITHYHTCEYQIMISSYIYYFNQHHNYHSTSYYLVAFSVSHGVFHEENSINNSVVEKMRLNKTIIIKIKKL